MKKITFITWNQNKADYLAKYLWFPVEHVKLDLDEIQSMDLKEIVEHKVKQAYGIIKKPVIVEDVSLEFEALWWLPWPFIKFFVENTPHDVICSMINWLSRNATAKCVFWYYDWDILEFFEWVLDWEISIDVSWENWYGWDRFFIPKWYNVTRSCLWVEDDKKTYLQIKPFEKLKKYLEKFND